MRRVVLVSQDSNADMGSRIFGAITELACARRFRRLRVAVAYASLAGCRDLAHGLDLHVDNWKAITKEWLISIDFGRTEPEALVYLRSLPNSTVRVADATCSPGAKTCS